MQPKHRTHPLEAGGKKIKMFLPFLPTPSQKLSVILKAFESFELHTFELRMQSMKMDEVLQYSGDGEGKKSFTYKSQLIMSAVLPFFFLTSFNHSFIFHLK